MKVTTVQTSFGNVCRICRCNSDTKKLVSIFGREDLLEKIASCLPITVHAEDQLPHQVCENCLNSIERSCELINKARSSEQYFFNFLKNGGEENINMVEEDSLQMSNKMSSLVLDGSFHCDLCGVQLPGELHLDSHIQEKHVNESVPPNTEFIVHKICSLCGQLFENDEIYVLHKCESHNKCSICKKLMPTKCLLNRHIQHSCKQLHYCPHCHKAFSGKMSLMKHIEGHIGEESQFECLACDKKLSDSGEVMEHTCSQEVDVNSHSSKKYKCYICGHAYKRQLNLAKHCLQHEPKSKWKFKCLKCNDVFEKEKSLHSHYEKVHKMPKTWICRFCGKSLSTKLSVQIHERIHTQVKPYVCEWCGNSFRCNANLIQHQAMHNGIRPHKCHVCGKKFSRPFFLRTHLRVHTGERPYKCDICEKRFTQMTDMRRHRKRHDKNSSIAESVLQQTVIIVDNTEEVSTAMFPEVTFEDSVPIETVELKVETSYD